MKVTLSVRTLQEVLDLASRFVSKHATLPILENVYIKWNIDTVVIRATDMEKYIEAEIPAELENEGSITVNAKTLWDIMRTIDDDSVTLHIDTTKETLHIQSSGDEFKIKWIPASEYVAVPSIQSDSSVELSTRAFSYWIGKVEYAVTEKNFSPVLTWVFMRTKEYGGKKKLVFVGTDSFRLAEYKADFEGSASWDFSFIVPKVHINDIKRVADYATEKEGETMNVSLSDNMVGFDFVTPSVKIHCMSLLIQGSFPDYENENIMPTTFNAKALLDKTQLEKAIKKISILTRDINNFISIQWGDSTLVLKSWETDMWEAETSAPALLEWAMIPFGMNGKYIGDFLKNIDWDDVEMHVVSAEKPVIFKDKEDESFTYVVRPLIK